MRHVPEMVDRGIPLSRGSLRIIRNKKLWTVVHLYENETLSLGMAAGITDRMRADERCYKKCQRLKSNHWLWSSSTAHPTPLSQGVDVFGGTLPKLTMATTNYSTMVKSTDFTGMCLNDKLSAAEQPARSKPFRALMTATDCHKRMGIIMSPTRQSTNAPLNWWWW